jgi:hypothetical protein
MSRTTQMGLMIALVLVTCAGNASADSFTFTLLPGNTGSAAPGGTLGFGYSIFNDSALWLVFSAPADVVVSDLDPSVITLDSSLFAFPAIDPGGTLSVAYVPGLAGLFELIWAASAPIGFSTSGTAFLSGQLCLDPTNALTCGDPTEQSASFNASVSQPSGPPSVPEPSTFLLLATGLAGFAVTRGWSHRRTRQ